jgi:hypothetical protein
MLLVYAVGGDGDSAKLGAFQGVKASNKGVTVLKGKSNVCGSSSSSFFVVLKVYAL